MSVLECDINGHTRNWLNFMVDGIYLKLGFFLKNSLPSTPSQTRLSNTHESSRKDVERAHGMLSSKTHDIKNNLRGWCVKDIVIIIKFTIIVHNVIAKERMSS